MDNTRHQSFLFPYSIAAGLTSAEKRELVAWLVSKALYGEDSKRFT